jgi:hypothetical protein
MSKCDLIKQIHQHRIEFLSNAATHSKHELLI